MGGAATRAGAALLGLLGLLASGCAPFFVKTDYDHEADFAKLETFAWFVEPAESGANPFEDNTLLRKRVRTAVERELTEKGYRVAPFDSADFRVTFHVTIENRTTYQGYAGYGGRYGRGYGYGANWWVPVEYREGTLILDIVRPSEGKGEDELIWRGWASGAVPTADSASERINAAVHEILKRFPPR